MNYFQAPTSVPDPALLKRRGDLKNAQFAHLNMIVDELNKLAPALHARVATTANITLSGTQTIDGIAVVAGDTVLVKNQSTGANNGLYVVKTGAWVRDEALDEASEFVEGRLFTVADGTVNGNSLFILEFTGTFVVGTTTATFVAMAGGATAAEEYVLLAGADTYTGTIANFPSAYASGQRITVRVASTNTITNPTVNINGIGAIAIKLDTTTVVPVGGLIVGRNYTLIYDGTNWQIDAHANLALKVDVASALFLPLLVASASMTSGDVAGTYSLGNGEQAVVSGGNSATPLQLVYINAAQFAAINSTARRMRLSMTMVTNATPPTGDYTLGLYPVTASGGLGAVVYTLGTLVAGSTAGVSAPLADGTFSAIGTPFAIPATGFYCIGVVTTSAVAASAHLHLNAKLEIESV